MGYREVRAWDEAHELLLGVYELAATLPADERFGLSSQLRNAVLSVPTNIVEGLRHQGTPHHARALDRAAAAVSKTEYLLLVGVDLEYVSQESADLLLESARRVARKVKKLRSRVGRAGDASAHAGASASGGQPRSRGEAACLARSTWPVARPVDELESLLPPDTWAPLNTSSESRDARNASADRNALKASRDRDQPSTARAGARRPR